jgi:hypothetical protein
MACLLFLVFEENRELLALAGDRLFVFHAEHVLELVQFLDTLILKRDFAADQLQAELDAMAFCQELLGFAELGFDVSRSRVVAQANFLDFLRLLRLVLAFLTFFLVLELAVIEDFGDRWIRLRRNNDQVQVKFLSATKRGGGVYFAARRTVLIDKKEAGRPDAVVDRKDGGGYRSLLKALREKAPKEGTYQR